jgi:periplasmic divalent cation tolerance protein
MIYVALTGDVNHLLIEGGNMHKYIVVFITASNQKEAEKIAHILVEKKLAACVNIIPRLTSIYRWQAKIERSEESLLIVKTVQSFWPRLANEIKRNHSYDVPEIIALPIVKGSKPYLDWLGSSVGKIKK